MMKMMMLGEESWWAYKRPRQKSYASKHAPAHNEIRQFRANRSVGIERTKKKKQKPYNYILLDPMRLCANVCWLYESYAENNTRRTRGRSINSRCKLTTAPPSATTAAVCSTVSSTRAWSAKVPISQLPIAYSSTAAMCTKDFSAAVNFSLYFFADVYILIDRYLHINIIIFVFSIYFEASFFFSITLLCVTACLCVCLVLRRFVFSNPLVCTCYIFFTITITIYRLTRSHI